MRARTTLSVALALMVVAGSLVFAACGTPSTDESTTQSSVVAATEAAGGRWEGEEVSLDWPDGWKSVAAQETMRWPLGRLIDSTALLALDRGDSYPRVELIRLDLSSGRALQNAFDEAYVTLADEWGTSLRNVTSGTTVVDGLSALVQTYELPNGEPYYKHQDVWIEYDGSVYVLAGRDGVWDFDENVLPDFEAVTESLRFGAAE